MSGSDHKIYFDTWAYTTPLEPPPIDTLHERVIEINGMPFQKRRDCNYKFDYYKLQDRIDKCRSISNTERNRQIALAQTPEEKQAIILENELNLLRNWIEDDLWFLVYFVMKNPLANHPFIVEACKEIENETGDSMELWARDHLKTTIISAGNTCKKVLNNPEKRVAIFSSVRPLAVKIQNLIKSLFESQILVKCFPDILYADPYKEAEKWTESPEGGLIVKRKGFYKEPTISSWGLLEGMPTGDHYTDIIYDDVVTIDTLSRDITQKVNDNFDMSENLGTRDVQRTVVGTPYRHDDSLEYIRQKKDPVTLEPMFKCRKKTATTDGSFNGPSAFLPEKTLAKKRAGKKYFFYCQQLIDPTPKEAESLNKNHILTISKDHLPRNLYKFMLVDGAGDEGRRQDRRADGWALGVIGVEPYRDDLGLSRIYILDLLIEELTLAQAQNEVVSMYIRNGRILKLGVEKVGMSTTEIHICSALRAKRKFLSVKQGNLEILKPGSRSKEFRIESAIALPLQHGKIHMLDSIPLKHRERFFKEMETFPSGRDDGLDMFSYLYDIIKNYRFGEVPKEEKKENAYDAAFRRAREKKSGGWLSV